jgi:dihydroxy-acid dehydratase
LTGFFGNLTSYGDAGFSVFLRKIFLSSMGYDETDLERPVIGIADTSSGYVTCHREMPQLIDAIRRGILEAGGLPVTFPTMALAEIFTDPTTMYLRNLMALETEEMIRAQPMDGVVLVGGCDKTVPAQLMAGISANVPMVEVVAGPMIATTWRGTRVGACTDCRTIWSKYRAGSIDVSEVTSASRSLATTGGTCMVMGTASTMACLTEALGLGISGSATPASPTGSRLAIGAESGRIILSAVQAGRTPRSVLSYGSFWNASVVLAAIGGSTNAIIHLLALARRAEIAFTLDDIGRATLGVPVLVDCKPVGSGYLDDFDAAGGVPALLVEIQEFLHLEARCVEGGTIADRITASREIDSSSMGLRSLSAPVRGSGAISILRGNLAPSGAIIKTAAASPELLDHQGPAVVFESIEDLMARIDDPELDVNADSVLVLRCAGPVAAGMPEAGGIPIPRKLAQEGVLDMVRVSDARMSGTGYGTVVLHVSPEAAVGGPLGAVRDGDIIRLDVSKGQIDVLLEDDELEQRLTDYRPVKALHDSLWTRLHRSTVQQAHLGADMTPENFDKEG